MAEEKKQVCLTRLHVLDDGFIVYQVQPGEDDNARHQAGVRIKHTFVLDNSGSMGNYTSQSLHQIAAPMFDMACVVPSALVVFASTVTITCNLTRAQDVKAVYLPQQSMTDITSAVIAAIDLIAAEPDVTVHHILTFLSDGKHEAPRKALEQSDLDTLKKNIAPDCKISVIIVGVDACDTTLAMKMKTTFETVCIPGLESIYYAKNHRDDLQVVGAQLLSGLEAFFTGGKLHQAHLITEGKEEENTVVFVDSGTSATTLFTTHSSTSCILVAYKPQSYDGLPVLWFDGQVPQMEGGLTSHEVLQCVESFCTTLIPKLSQMKIANNSNALFEKRLDMLSRLIQSAQKMLEKSDSEQDQRDEETCRKGTLSASISRIRAMNKQLRGVKMYFEAERSKIEQLKIKVANSSSAQAAYLVGMNQKYATKAVKRAGTLDKSTDEVLKELHKVKFPEVFPQYTDNVQTSILSCNSAAEQLAEWPLLLGQPDVEFESIYSLLVAFGFLAYPISLQFGSAVQMDPFQTSCEDIETVPVDTCMVMFAKQMQRSLLSPNSQKPIENCLVLVDCTCPEASLVAMKTDVYKFLMSCTFCKDLYMFNSQQTYAMHAHALIGTMKKYQDAPVGKEFIDLAVKIVYSMKKFWRANDYYAQENKGLFEHWFVDLGGITQSSTDKCNHPAQLVLLYACLEENVQEDPTVPMVNLFNEVLARQMRKWFHNDDQENDDAHITLLQRLFNIHAEDSPKPIDDVFASEPLLEFTRESCKRYASFNNACFEQEFKCDVVSFVEQKLRPYYVAVCFAGMMRKEIFAEELETKMEALGHVPSSIIETLHKDMLPAKGMEFLFGRDVILTMFAQAVMHHTNATRVSIVDKDVLHPSTLQDIIVDLRMVHYFKACKIKKAEYTKLIGNASTESGMQADDDEFNALLGHHTHGLSREKFQGLKLAAERSSEAKKRAFIAKSNDTVHFGKK